MAKTLVSLTRLHDTGDDLRQWARQHIDELQRIFLGSWPGGIDGNAVKEGSVGTSRLLATAGGLWNDAAVVYNPGPATPVLLPDAWVFSGDMVFPGNGTLVLPDYDHWGMASFYCRVTPSVVNAFWSLEVDSGTGWYTRAIVGTSAVGYDVNLSLVAPFSANTKLRMTIVNNDTVAKTIINYPAPFFTYSVLGQVVEP